MSLSAEATRPETILHPDAPLTLETPSNLPVGTNTLVSIRTTEYDRDGLIIDNYTFSVKFTENPNQADLSDPLNQIIYTEQVFARAIIGRHQGDRINIDAQDGTGGKCIHQIINVVPIHIPNQ